MRNNDVSDTLWTETFSYKSCTAIAHRPCISAHKSRGAIQGQSRFRGMLISVSAWRIFRQGTWFYCGPWTRSYVAGDEWELRPNITKEELAVIMSRTIIVFTTIVPVRTSGTVHKQSNGTRGTLSSLGIFEFIAVVHSARLLSNECRVCFLSVCWCLKFICLFICSAVQMYKQYTEYNVWFILLADERGVCR